MLSAKPLSALVAVTAALAAASPAAGDSPTGTTAALDPTVCELMNSGSLGLFGPTMLPGATSLADVRRQAADAVGCPPPAAQSSLLPMGPWGP
jgi:hypothetical protein